LNIISSVLLRKRLKFHFKHITPSDISALVNRFDWHCMTSRTIIILFQ